MRPWSDPTERLTSGLVEPGLARSDEAGIVVVDDDLVSRELLCDIVTRLHAVTVRGFGDGREALAWCRAHPPDLVVTDYQMPELDGLQLLAALRADPATSEVPVMMVTAVGDRQVLMRALELGANDFLTKPLDPGEVGIRIRNLRTVRSAQRVLADRSRALASEVRRVTAALTAREQEIVFRLSRAAEYRDWETGEHILRVAHGARLIAQQLGLGEEEVEAIFLSTPMHDVGKIGIPDGILRKEGRLTPEEFTVMRTHTTIGHGILSGSSSELLAMAADIARSHHERVDGAGYPDGLRGDAIPLAGRIVAVADVFDALVTDRPYRSRWSVERAVAEIRKGSGTHFDPDVVAAFDRQLAAIVGLREQIGAVG